LTAAFFEFEEVLSKPFGGDPIPMGITLLRLMRPGYRLILSSMQSEPALVERWLLVQGFPPDVFGYQYHLTPDEVDLSEDEVFERHLDKALVHIPIELVVTPSPSKAAICMRRSITSLLFGSPATARPEFRPGKNVRPWQEIEEEVSRRRILRTKASVGTDYDD
jgi:hypothetical protein